MTSVVMPEGAIVLDAAGFQGVSNFTPFKEFGASGVSLYLVGRYAVDASCVQAAWLAGLEVQLNWERSPSAYLNGASGGHAAVAEAVPVAERLGWLHESPIVFSATDQGIAPGDYVKADNWYQAMVGDMLTANAVGGAYGPSAYLTHLAQQWWWPEDFILWHWAGDNAIPEPGAWAQQLLGQRTIAGVTVDLNRIYKPYPYWSGFGPDPINPETTVVLGTDDINAIAAAAVAALIGSGDYASEINQLGINVDRSAEFSLIIGNAVKANIPNGTGTPTLDQIVTAFKQVLNNTTLTINFQTP